jgi:hypothetical protein
MEERIADRLRNSGDPHADIVTKHGEGPTRAFTNIHHSANHTRPLHSPAPTEGESE